MGKREWSPYSHRFCAKCGLIKYMSGAKTKYCRECNQKGVRKKDTPVELVARQLGYKSAKNMIKAHESVSYTNAVKVWTDAYAKLL